ncbi:MAG: integral rane sensor signal transduction histidine kinase [Frankiales bacterium]|nr:integral rane sensor signal transduction histidine kinase [Frankiales bacterium]
MSAGRLAVLIATLATVLLVLAAWAVDRADEASLAAADLREQRDTAALALAITSTAPDQVDGLLESTAARTGASICLRQADRTLRSGPLACTPSEEESPRATDIATSRGVLSLRSDRTPLEADRAQAEVEVYGAHVGLTLLLSIFVFTFGRRRDDEAVVAVARTLGALAEGDLAARAAVPPDGATAVLAARANAVADLLQVTVERQRTFLADAAHQLRNPLSALHLRAENLEAHIRPGGTRAHGRLLQDVRRLERTLDDLVVFARAGEREAETQVVDVLAIVRERLPGWLPKANARGLRIRQLLPDHAVALSRTGALDQALDVVLDNALTHAPPGTEVTVVVVPSATHVEVRVEDRGAGLSAEAQEQAAGRGWQGDPRDGGSGLGLAIAGLLLSSSGGRLELANRTRGRGLVAVLRLPTPAVELEVDHRPAWARQPSED